MTNTNPVVTVTLTGGTFTTGDLQAFLDRVQSLDEMSFNQEIEVGHAMVYPDDGDAYPAYTLSATGPVEV